MYKDLILTLLENIYCKCCSLCQDSEKLIKENEKNIIKYHKEFIRLSKNDCDEIIKICKKYLYFDERFEILKKEYVNIKKKLVLPSYNDMSQKEKLESIFSVRNT